MTKVTVICGWCGKDFVTENSRRVGGKDPNAAGYYPVRICPHCGRTVQASKKEFTGNVVGRKRWKAPSQNGDVV